MSHIRELDGMQVLAVANRNIGRIAGTIKELDIGYDEIVLVESKNKINLEDNNISTITIEDSRLDINIRKKLNQLAGEDKLIVADDLAVLFVLDDVDVIVDATGVHVVQHLSNLYTLLF
ncbi:unnamed protein product [marine sediment metagenome]|uniref:RCK N-terminal domain-containing protein n=1 Tax=marine sediment metagenome TaxID=412755 RepID=X1PWY4_9ZZZZ